MRWFRIGLLVAGLLAVVPPVLAQTKDENQKALALGHDGLAAYNKGDWAEARAKFAEADRLAHSPVFVLYLARSARNAGDLAAAKVAYDKLAVEVVPVTAPAPWGAAVVSGRQEREELEKRLAELAAAAAAASASATASAAPTATTTAPTATAPTSTATAPTSAPRATGTTAPFGVPSGSAVGPGGPGPGEQQGSIVPGLGAIALGAVALGVGTGMFVHAKSMADGVLERCIDRPLCPAEDRAVKDSAIGLADGATAAFAVGGGLLAAGVVLLIVRPGSKSAPAKAGLAVQPGWASIRVSGTF